MEYKINPDTFIPKQGDKFHFIFTTSKLIPDWIEFDLIGKVAETNISTARVKIYRAEKIGNDLHIYVQVISSGSPVLAIIGVLTASLGVIVALGLTLRETRYVIAESIPNVAFLIILSLGAWYIIKKKRKI